MAKRNHTNFRWLLPVGVLVGVGLTARSGAAENSQPVLLSRTGGGGWANVKELEQAALGGNVRAQAQLGEMLLRGNGIAPDERRAVRLLEQAARGGHAGAAFRIGMLLMEGEAGVAKDPARALGYFRAAATGGEKEAFFNIGAAYGSARGVKRDYGEALGWLIVAVKRGADPRAEQDLRGRIAAQRSWIARGERRAAEIEREFAGKSVKDFLPPEASLAVPYTEPEMPLTPAAPAAVEARRSAAGEFRPPPPEKPAEALRPALPPLAPLVPPTLPRP
jgi:TPR repeat protein